MSDILTVLEQTARSLGISLPQEQLLKKYLLSDKVVQAFPYSLQPFSWIWPCKCSGDVCVLSPFCLSSSED